MKIPPHGSACIRPLSILAAGFNHKRRWSEMKTRNWMLLLAMLLLTGRAVAGEQWIYMFLPAENDDQQGFARINNLSNQDGTVEIIGIDDSGQTSSGTITLSMTAGESVNFNSDDLEDGNTNKGLSGRLGNGSGNWRLKFTSDLDLNIAGLFRNTSGFVNLLHSTAPTTDDLSHSILFFNPASNTNQVSRLRIINTSDSTNNISITGTDHDGLAAGPVTFSIGPQASAEINASELENGAPERSISGAFGDGNGKWRLTVTSSQSAKVMSLLEDPNGYLSNLSDIIPLENGTYLMNYMLPADSTQQGFIRLSNPNDTAVTITLNGLDDAGTSASLTIDLGAQESINFNSDDLETGNANKGLSGSFGDGSGNWRLTFSAPETIYVQGLFRTTLGFVNLVQDNVNTATTTSHSIAFFNPASNANQVSFLRLINPGNSSNTFTISGIDDNGAAGTSNYSVTLGALQAMSVTSTDLENGGLGDGSGKWRLTVNSSADSYVQSMLMAPDDYLSNLSGFLDLPGSLSNIYTSSWMLNNSERSTTIEDGSGNKALVNVQSVIETTSGANSYVRMEATSVPNYAHVLTTAEIEWLNNRPKATNDFGAGNATTASAGEAVAFGSDINYNSNNSCTEGSGQGFWPPGPVCPEDVSHSALFRTAPAQETTSPCQTGLDAVGHWINGVSVYNWGDGQSYNSERVWTNMAPSFEIYDLDICHGHAANNDYHHHSYPHCLAEQIGDQGTGHSPVYGFAMDGYPIYGPWQAASLLAKSCWVARDYSAATTAGGCADGTRSCQLVDVYDLSQGVTSVNSGPALSGTVDTQSGNAISSSSGIYLEDYYFDAQCQTQGDAYLDQYNGHDSGDGRGYHYHVTVVDDSVNKTLGIDLLPVFPYYLGPSLYGEVSSTETDWSCSSNTSGGGMNGGGMNGGGPP